MTPAEEYALARMGPQSSKDDRWHHVLLLVASGEWYGHATVVQLANEWGIAPDTVARYRTEAIRCIRVLVDDDAREDIRQMLASRCDRMYRQAMDESFVFDTKGNKHKHPDCKAAVQSVRLHANLYGLLSKRINVNLGELADRYSAMSDDELNEEWQKLRAQGSGNGNGEVH